MLFSNKPLLWITPLLILWFTICLGDRPFASPDEGRYVEIPREMVVSGDYLTPRLNGVKYFEKPPLFYWMQAGAIRLWGTQEWAMRLSCVFFSILGCLSVYLFGRRFYGKQAGIAACLVLAASPLYYALSRLIILDMAITTFVTLSLFSFILTIYTPPGRQRRLWAYSFYACSALGVLTKGLMALAIPGPIILLWAFFTKRWKDLWPAYIPSGTLLFLAITVPWHILVSLENPEFPHKYFIVEHVLRYTTSLHMRTQPFWFFMPVLVLGFFPWTSLLWKSIKNGLKSPINAPQKEITQFLLIWAVWTFGFFSLSNSKLIPYILPCFAPLALILGHYWTTLKDLKEKRQIIITFTTLASLLGSGGLVTLAIFPQLIDHKPYLWVDFTILTSTLLFLGLLAIFSFYKNWVRTAFSTLPLAAFALVIGVIRLMPELQQPSVKPLAQIIQSLKKPGNIIGSYKTYYQDLPVYVQQTISIIENQGELSFGCEVEDCSQWMLNEQQFLDLWKSQKRLFIIARAKEIESLSQRIPTFHYHLLGKDQRNILITNSFSVHGATSSP